MEASKFGPGVLSSIGRILAVTSCKGGVGKSTVSFELAHRLAARGNRVGLFDADVQGPSLPAQLGAAVSARGIAGEVILESKPFARLSILSYPLSIIHYSFCCCI